MKNKSSFYLPAVIRNRRKRSRKIPAENHQLLILHIINTSICRTSVLSKISLLYSMILCSQCRLGYVPTYSLATEDNIVIMFICPLAQSHDSLCIIDILGS